MVLPQVFTIRMTKHYLKNGIRGPALLIARNILNALIKEKKSSDVKFVDVMFSREEIYEAYQKFDRKYLIAYVNSKLNIKVHSHQSKQSLS